MQYTYNEIGWQNRVKSVLDSSEPALLTGSYTGALKEIVAYTEVALIVQDKFEQCNEKQSAKVRDDNYAAAVSAANAIAARRRPKLWMKGCRKLKMIVSINRSLLTSKKKR
jgi:hypothetical protein